MRSILLVDDSPIIRQELRRFLEGQGYLVREATTGREGLERFVAQPSDLIILDVNMPDMDGLEMLAALRGRAEGAQVPAFVLTSETSRALMARGKQAGATAWMLKPFKPEGIRRGLQRLFSGG
jgi:two-component system chemotaxis response regulator CheY